MIIKESSTTITNNKRYNIMLNNVYIYENNLK